MENRISVTVSEEALANINKAIAAINENLPYLINLTPAERHQMAKMGDKTLAFVNKAFEYANQNPKIVPSFLDLNEFAKDSAAVTNLKKVLIPIEQLSEKLSDTNLMAGSEAYMAALAFYNAVKGAAKAGEPGMKSIYDDLQSRFPGRGKNGAAAKKNRQ